MDIIHNRIAGRITGYSVDLNLVHKFLYVSSKHTFTEVTLNHEVTLNETINSSALGFLLLRLRWTFLKNME